MFTHSKLRVFVVDDEPIIAGSLAKILENDGYRAAPYTNPEQALKDATADPPDLVISDVVMPGMSGVELAEEIKSQIPNCKILLFSAQAETDHLFRRAKVQPDEFKMLAKPVHPRVLLGEVARLLASSEPDSLATNQAVASMRALPGAYRFRLRNYGG